MGTRIRHCHAWQICRKQGNSSISGNLNAAPYNKTCQEQYAQSIWTYTDTARTVLAASD